MYSLFEISLKLNCLLASEFNSTTTELTMHSKSTENDDMKALLTNLLSKNKTYKYCHSTLYNKDTRAKLN